MQKELRVHDIFKLGFFFALSESGTFKSFNYNYTIEHAIKHSKQ